MSLQAEAIMYALWILGYSRISRSLVGFNNYIPSCDSFSHECRFIERRRLFLPVLRRSTSTDFGHDLVNEYIWIAEEENFIEVCYPCHIRTKVIEIKFYMHTIVLGVSNVETFFEVEMGCYSFLEFIRVVLCRNLERWSYTEATRDAHRPTDPFSPFRSSYPPGQSHPYPYCHVSHFSG